jgi:hypothetical protein
MTRIEHEVLLDSLKKEAEAVIKEFMTRMVVWSLAYAAVYFVLRYQAKSIKKGGECTCSDSL